MIGIQSTFAWSVLSATLIGLQCQLAGVACGSARKKYNVQYPDMGCGRDAAKLTDEEWKDFNNVIRVHYNYVEQLPIILSNVLMAGLFFPKFSGVAGGIYMIGRYLYGSGYKKHGAKGRLVGVAILDLALISLMGANLYGVHQALSKA